MTLPISIRLDEEVRRTLEEAARAEGVPLATYLRSLARERARQVRRDSIKRESKEIGEYLRRSKEAAMAYEEWGTPTAEL